MKNLIHLTLAAALVATSIGCKNTAPTLTGPQREPIKAIHRANVTVTEDGLSVPYDPRVDILLILDDSQSMEAHLSSLSKNINEFINEFAKIKAIDFHIGFTFVHDRSRYGVKVPEVCEATGKTLWSPPGTLQPLVGFDKGRRYLTQEDSKDLVQILTNSLDPLRKDSPLVKKFSNGPDDKVNGAQPCAQGAEQEESFSPLLANLENPAFNDAASPNAGFRRPGAFFVAIIVSDAKDAMIGVPVEKGGYGKEGEQAVFDRIAAATGSDLAKGDQRFRVFSVAIKPGDYIHAGKTGRQCKPDRAFYTAQADGSEPKLTPHTVTDDENPLAILAQMTSDSGQDPVLSICDDDYGKKLAEYGKQVKEDTLPNVRIPLEKLSEGSDDPNKKLKVMVGGDPLVYGTQWYYENDNSITIIGKNIDWSKYEGNNEIIVDRVPVDLTEETTKPAM